MASRRARDMFRLFLTYQNKSGTQILFRSTAGPPSDTDKEKVTTVERLKGAAERLVNPFIDIQLSGETLLGIEPLFYSSESNPRDQQRFLRAFNLHLLRPMLYTQTASIVSNRMTRKP